MNFDELCKSIAIDENNCLSLLQSLGYINSDCIVKKNFYFSDDDVKYIGSQVKHRQKIARKRLRYSLSDGYFWCKCGKKNEYNKMELPGEAKFYYRCDCGKWFDITIKVKL